MVRNPNMIFEFSDFLFYLQICFCFCIPCCRPYGSQMKHICSNCNTKILENVSVHFWSFSFSDRNSVARTFLSEIADFGRIYRQIRQAFGPKSRKICQFLDLFYILITPYLKKFPFLLHFYSLIFSFFFYMQILKTIDNNLLMKIFFPNF